ncbi:MAG: response regulator [Treponema sp.]|nr:response regulator [Treponema sp.]
MTILIVDDSRLIRNTLKRFIQTMNIPCQYVEADNGQEALERLKAQSINLVFLDWNMPKMSGIEFLKEVRAMDEYKTLPIIMLTSEGARDNVIEAIKGGATDYILKPIREQHVREKIVRLIS